MVTPAFGVSSFTGHGVLSLYGELRVSSNYATSLSIIYGLNSCRIYGNHYPWPDAWTNFVRQHCWYTRDPPACRLICCICRFRPRAGNPGAQETHGDGGEGSTAGEGEPPFITLDDHVGESGDRNSYRNRPGTPRTSLDLGNTGLRMNDIEANLDEDGDGEGDGGMGGCKCCPPRMADGQYAVVCRHRSASDPARALQQTPQLPEVHVLRAGLFGTRGKSGSWTHRSSRTASSDDIADPSDNATGKLLAGLDTTEALELGLSLSTNITPKSPGSGGSPTYMRLDAVSALTFDGSEV
jgi:hypothetical protein